jgi:hypothetical protein
MKEKRKKEEKMGDEPPLHSLAGFTTDMTSEATIHPNQI